MLFTVKLSIDFFCEYHKVSQTKQNYCSIFSTFGDETFSIVGVVAGFDTVFVGTVCVGSLAGTGRGAEGVTFS